MEYKFKATIKFSVEIDDSPLSEKEKTYDNYVKIKSFVTEFLKHPEAVEAFYRSFFLDQFHNNSTADWELLCQQLDYKDDYGPLFKEIAQHCPPDVNAYITDLFSGETDDIYKNKRKEVERELLEDLLNTLKVEEAEFVNI